MLAAEVKSKSSVWDAQDKNNSKTCIWLVHLVAYFSAYEKLREASWKSPGLSEYYPHE